jgi:hypothetical protein
LAPGPLERKKPFNQTESEEGVSETASRQSREEVKAMWGQRTELERIGTAGIYRPVKRGVPGWVWLLGGLLLLGVLAG